MSTPKQAFLIATQELTDSILLKYHAIRNATQAYGDTFILLHQKDDTLVEGLDKVNHHLFTNDILYGLNYRPIWDSLLPGSNHFSLLHFFLHHPGYTFYWYIEFDVEFTGSWSTFFDAIQPLQTDFISTTMKIPKTSPKWPWWSSLTHPHKTIPETALVGSFNPLYRISAPALSFIHEALLDGWSGHHEVLFTSLLYHKDFNMLDMGGTGLFVPPGFVNRFYTQATYRWRPTFPEVGPLKNKLYHPVKPLEPFFVDDSF